MEADLMTKTVSILALLTGVLLLSGCASRCSEWCQITHATKQVLK
jgi:PBP1b-binding outer membrane lipoprotein LpoB